MSRICPLTLFPGGGRGNIMHLRVGCRRVRFVVARLSQELRLLLEEVLDGFALVGVGRAAKGKAIGSVDLFPDIGTGEGGNTLGKALRPFESHLTVEEVQRLDWARRDI